MRIYTIINCVMRLKSVGYWGCAQRKKKLNKTNINYFVKYVNHHHSLSIFAYTLVILVLIFFFFFISPPGCFGWIVNLVLKMFRGFIKSWDGKKKKEKNYVLRAIYIFLKDFSSNKMQSSFSHTNQIKQCFVYLKLYKNFLIAKFKLTRKKYSAAIIMMMMWNWQAN